MKEIKFKTSKGEFLVVEGEEQAYKLWGSKNFISKLSEIIEEQASEIVDYSILKNLYVSYSHGFSTDSYVYNTAIESLHSLLKSKGVHLYNNLAPLLHHTRLESEQKIFYNPYIFKLNE